MAAQSTTPPSPSGSTVPLALWPVAQTSAQYQRAGRYLPACAGHPAKLLPELARRIVTEYSAPGDLVVDVMAGIGTTVVEAALLGRRAVGVELDPHWVDLARANLDHMVTGRARRRAEIRLGDARRLTRVLGDVMGTVDLVCTSPPYGCEVGNVDQRRWGKGIGLRDPATENYSMDRTNLGHARGDAYRAAMAEIYAGCFDLLRPGGLLVAVTKHSRRKGRLLDLAGLTTALARDAGFTYIGHTIALHAAIRRGELSGRPSFWQTQHLGRARERGEPVHLLVHEDVLAFARKGRPDAH